MWDEEAGLTVLIVGAAEDEQLAPGAGKAMVVPWRGGAAPYSAGKIRPGQLFGVQLVEVVQAPNCTRSQAIESKRVTREDFATNEPLVPYPPNT